MLKNYCSSLILLTICLFSANQAAAKLVVLRPHEGETVRHSVVLLRGTCELTRGASPVETKPAVAINESAKDKKEAEVTGQAARGQFCVLTKLAPGENRIRIKVGKEETVRVLHYKPQTNPYFLRIIYHTPKDGSTNYQTQKEKDPQDYEDKLRTAMLLMQTFTAEVLVEKGYGRKTFNLEYNDKNEVKVNLLRGEKTKEEYWAMDEMTWFNGVRNEVKKQFPNDKAINLVIPSYTFWKPELKKTRPWPLAHTARGGGNFAIFGSAGLFTWPSSLNDVVPAFSDATLMDPEKVFDDSAGRKVCWANAATGLGAAMHEFGHNFFLMHGGGPRAIMQRGFDHFARPFLLVEPPCSRHKEPIPVDFGNCALWDPTSMECLVQTRWFAMDAKDWKNGDFGRISFDDKNKKMTIRAKYGLAYWAIYDKSDTRHYESFRTNIGKPTEYVVSFEELLKKAGKPALTLFTLDAEGQPSFTSVKLGVKK